LTVTARLDRSMIDEGTDCDVGDTLEISFENFSGELNDVPPDRVLEVANLHVVELHGIAGISGRSYRVRVVAARTTDCGDKLLSLDEAPRDRLPTPSIPLG
jgi:hypothetical protein